MNNAKQMQTRSGCHDMWNAFMVKNATFASGIEIISFDSKTCKAFKEVPHE